MEQDIYVDVLLVTNYIVNTLLIMCTGKLSGRLPKRRRVVAAALFGGAASLTIFLPFHGFILSALLKLAISAAIVLTAFQFVSARVFFKQMLLFFAVSFSFAGVALGIWLTLAPTWMTYYNGVVYFDISPVILIATTAAAYMVMLLSDRFVKGNGFAGKIYETTISIGGKAVTLSGLMDTGNHLREPFSNTPVIVCFIAQVSQLLPQELTALVLEGRISNHDIYNCGMPVRLVPYSNVGGSGILPAVRADFVNLKKSTQTLRIEQAYIGLSNKEIGNERYSCLLTPDLVGMNIKNTVTVVPHK